MADALCGPSNPLQSFSKQAQLDRTLQQDRLVGPRHSAAQGFRTQDPRAGSLDADFHAFENSQPNPILFQQPSPQHALSSPTYAAPVAGWAADFQRLHISQTPSPIPVQQFRSEAPLVKSTNGVGMGMWHDEFIRQRSSASTPTAKGKQTIRENTTVEPQQMYTNGWNPMMSNMNGHLGLQNPIQQTQSDLTHQDAYNHMSDVDFEAAFAEALQEAEAMDQIQQTPDQPQVQQHDDLSSDQEFSRPDVRIGSDAIRYTDTKDRTLDLENRDADELAKTAGQLLNLVQHDSSEKFQNSQFLDLMRRIRDREVEVQNNDLQTTNGHGSQSQTTTHQSHGNFNIPENLKPHDPNTFAFPDLNDVYEPSALDLDDHQFDASNPSTTTYGVGNAPRQLSSIDPEYSTYSDEYPSGSDNGFSEAYQPRAKSQIQALHPGGRYYPEQSPKQERAEMSGAVNLASAGAGVITSLGSLDQR